MQHGFVDRGALAAAAGRRPASNRYRAGQNRHLQLALGPDRATSKTELVDLGSGKLLVALLEAEERAVVHDGMDTGALFDPQKND